MRVPLGKPLLRISPARNGEMLTELIGEMSQPAVIVPLQAVTHFVVWAPLADSIFRTHNAIHQSIYIGSGSERDLPIFSTLDKDKDFVKAYESCPLWWTALLAQVWRQGLESDIILGVTFSTNHRCGQNSTLL